MDFTPILILVLVNKKVVDFLKELIPAELQNKTVQAISWAVGVALAFLFASSVFGDGIKVWDGLTLAALDGWGLVVFGLALGSGAGVAADAIERKNPEPEREPIFTATRRPSRRRPLRAEGH